MRFLSSNRSLSTARILPWNGAREVTCLKYLSDMKKLLCGLWWLNEGDIANKYNNVGKVNIIIGNNNLYTTIWREEIEQEKY